MYQLKEVGPTWEHVFSVPYIPWGESLPPPHILHLWRSAQHEAKQLSKAVSQTNPSWFLFSWAFLIRALQTCSYQRLGTLCEKSVLMRISEKARTSRSLDIPCTTFIFLSTEPRSRQSVKHTAQNRQDPRCSEAYLQKEDRTRTPCSMARWGLGTEYRLRFLTPADIFRISDKL